ncbi:MAG: hypothetical protein ACJAUG_003360 [Halioglobus sp.]|jgi:hypothetical protein
MAGGFTQINYPQAGQFQDNAVYSKAVEGYALKY